MSSPPSRAQSPAPEAKSPNGKEKSPTPGPASPTGNKSPTPAPAMSPTPAPASPVADEPLEPGGLLPGAHWGQQELHDDLDSTLGSDAESSTASITSSILQYRNFLGRTYHSDSVTDGEYWGPNDAKANETLDIIHEVVVKMFDGKLYTAPLRKDIQTAIDIGTGTGVWAIDFADEHPDCTVIGTDISPIQPSWVPPNCKFEINDAHKEWTYEENYFDFIHIRWLTGTIKNWHALYKEAYRCAKPGGWIEHLDADSTWYSLDGTMPETCAVAQWGQIWKKLGGFLGTEFDIASSNLMVDGMREAGFTNITSEIHYLPLAPWSTDPKLKELGLYASVAVTHDIEGFLTYLMPTYLGWTQKDITNYAATLRREFREAKIHFNVKWRLVKAQKPLDA
ncbi:S-adenosyl-L-methionine-dependent methyltransferase [Neurospora hispaniola]|uniref:S-adenosyl-L-methionine-dependent methyltransferase n=1 Tax=Neurospora hispaniola TaxID=588809 RepID=A0AAJ0I114_9PEZI|nr:S-adenosyl-L-methionine-dependent methyltransferase [Neurospora hispaniola]